MKVTLLTAVIVISLSACREKSINDAGRVTKTDTIYIRDTIYYKRDWQNGFGLSHNEDQDSIWGKPVSFYINDPACSPIAIEFYYGNFMPSDDRITAALLSLVTTNIKKLRPFYRWCLNKTILVQDGALGEYTGVPARQYAEQYPLEFFEYMDSDTSGSKYNDWVESIQYSGFYDGDDYRDPASIQKRMSAAMKRNCKDCSEQMMKRIDSLARECFPIQAGS